MGNADFLAQATEWAKGGRRSVKIEIGNAFHNAPEPEVSAWFYDFELGVGELITPGEPIPDARAMADRKARSLEEELDQLKGARVHSLEQQLETLKTRMEAPNA